ncbi:N-acetylmuramoyl-L-alanine amidase [Bacillus cereus group sp. BfR-BA-01326]|uniref:N-acetylmuramoyl-L-alanine amidase n=1 Tax=Bacillus cereus group TaxID=86661 RepID=UPI001F59D53D|nr:N-acetylmuramoyl-L-alanine amidase [Bacillus cereus group sp. BfR-BA-01326]
MKVSSHAGHSAKVHGADYGNRKEHEMAREVNAVFIGKLRALGHSVEDDTDESGVTASGVVNNQIRNVNSRREDVAFSFHLNASNGQGHGVEVLCYSNKELPMANKIAQEISNATGWKNRGGKLRPDLGVIGRTINTMYLIECGFIDNDSDMSKWNSNTIADAVIRAYFGQSAPSQPTTPPQQNSSLVYEHGVVKTTANVNLRRQPNLQGSIIRVLPSGTDWEFFARSFDGRYWWYDLGAGQWIREDNARKI